MADQRVRAVHDGRRCNHTRRGHTPICNGDYAPISSLRSSSGKSGHAVAAAFIDLPIRMHPLISQNVARNIVPFRCVTPLLFIKGPGSGKAFANTASSTFVLPPTSSPKATSSSIVYQRTFHSTSKVSAMSTFYDLKVGAQILFKFRIILIIDCSDRCPSWRVLV